MVVQRWALAWSKTTTKDELLSLWSVAWNLPPVMWTTIIVSIVLNVWSLPFFPPERRSSVWSLCLTSMWPSLRTWPRASRYLSAFTHTHTHIPTLTALSSLTAGPSLVWQWWEWINYILPICSVSLQLFSYIVRSDYSSGIFTPYIPSWTRIFFQLDKRECSIWISYPSTSTYWSVCLWRHLQVDFWRPESPELLTIDIDVDIRVSAIYLDMLYTILQQSDMEHE